MSAPPPAEVVSRRRRWFRRLLRLSGYAAALLLLFLGVAYLQARQALGHAPSGDRLTRMQASPNWREGSFFNELPQRQFVRKTIDAYLNASEFAEPQSPLEVVAPDPRAFDLAPEEGLRVTWLGHSIALIEIDGQTVLTDPVWGPRTSPLSWLGPEAWYAPLMALEDLPEIDAVLISHDHYDHLDFPTIEIMREWDTEFIVPLGVGAHLEHWGIPADRITELDWWQSHEVGDVRIVSTPARHASGRHFFDRDRTLWAGYALQGAEHRVFFSGDTGPFPEIPEIGERLGPFDVTMIEVGAYNQGWPDWHMGPEQAVQAHADLGGGVLLPIHWGLFNLSTHGWTEPIERVLVAAESLGVSALTLRPGESWQPGADATTNRWWPDRPWRTSAEYPLVSSMGN